MFNLFNKSDTDDLEFIHSQIGTDVYINDSATVTRVLITNTNLAQNYDDKKISSLSPLNRGDIVVYTGEKYMLISEINGQRYNKSKGIMRQLPHTVIVNDACNFIHLDCYITVGDLGVTDGKVLSVLDGNITVYTRNNVDVKLASRFFIHGQPFKITGIDSFSQQGILILSCDKDLIDTVKDDLINDIAGGLSCHVDITNEPTSIMIGSTLQLAWTSTNNVPVVFTSSNNTIATVDAKGLVRGVAEGSFTITISNSTNGFIYDKLPISIYAPEVYTMSLYNSSNKHNLTYNEQIIVNKHVYVNGATTTDKTVTYSLVYIDQITTVPSSVAELTVDASNVATIKNVNIGIPESIYVKAVFDSDTSIVDYYTLNLDYYRPVTKTISIVPSATPINEIILDKTKIYTANIYSGTTLINEDVTWNLYADDQVSTPTAANQKIISQTGTAISIKALKVTYYVQLKCTLVSDPSIFVWQRIKLRPLF